MLNFQDIVFMSTQTYSEIFKSALVYLSVFNHQCGIFNIWQLTLRKNMPEYGFPLTRILSFSKNPYSGIVYTVQGLTV